MKVKIAAQILGQDVRLAMLESGKWDQVQHEERSNELFKICFFQIKLFFFSLFFGFNKIPAPLRGCTANIM